VGGRICGGAHGTREGPPAAAVDEDERERLVEDLVARLEERGAPAGMWLVSIREARVALQEADGLLRRLEDALIRDASERPLAGP
jgi:hypothetical protein